MSKIEVIEDGALTLRPSPDQLAAWSKSAGEQPLGEWLEEVADGASARLAYNERTWPLELTLKMPFDFGKERRVERITVRRGKLADIKGIKLGGEVPTQDLITIASRLTGEPTQIIERLDVEDAGEVMAIALDFYALCLGGGRKR